MAKQTKSAVAPATASPEPKTPAAPKAEKGLNDRFIANFKEDGKTAVDPSKKIAPQAQVIVNTIAAAGKEGITRTQLNAHLKGVLTTRQPESRIVTYYQKLIQEVGCVKLVKGAEEAAPAAPAAA